MLRQYHQQLRDLKQIGTKMQYVLVPQKTQGLPELRDWDLWGPLILCILLASYVFLPFFFFLYFRWVLFLLHYLLLLLACRLFSHVSQHLSACIICRTLSYSAQPDKTAVIFAAVFVIVWCGAGIVTVNAVLLGGSVSFFQSVCVLGYCICPLNIASICVLIWGNPIFKLILVIACFFWATRASVGFMAQLVDADRRLLGVYPVVLFYLALSWMVLVQ